MKEVLLNIYERDLQKLTKEINLYQNEEDLWKTTADITNSGGNLCLHLIGNLKHFFGVNLGGTDFIRTRDAEFSSKNVSRSEILTEIENAAGIVATTLQNLTDEDLEKDYPEPHHGEIVKTKWMLIHLLTHFDYHLGQINYHRRFIS